MADELLALLQTRGRAQQALDAFLRLIDADALAISSTDEDSTTALACLRAAMGSRCRPPAKARSTADQRKRMTVVAAKVAQGVIKAYTAAGSGSAREEADAMVAMDLACLALCVVGAQETTIRLGDLVVDNMLYQVFKTYAQLKEGRSAAMHVLACIHVRLWQYHSRLCESLRHSDVPASPIITKLKGPDCKVTAAYLLPLTMFPAPQEFHVSQFARLLIGVVSSCVTMLQASNQNEAILTVTTKTLRPWIDHLSKVPGVDPKLAASFYDRTFRILWKSAAAMDAAKPATDMKVKLPLMIRSSALSFMSKCPTYTPLYLIQQTYRVGVQYERNSKRTNSDFSDIHEFFMRTADLLAQKSAKSNQLYTSAELEWDYLQWLEYFVAVCEGAQRPVDAILVADFARWHIEQHPTIGPALHACFAGIRAVCLLEMSSSEPEVLHKAAQTFQVNVKSRGLFRRASSDSIKELMQFADKKLTTEEREKVVAKCLMKVQGTESACLLAMASRTKAFVPFLTRCIKKTTAKLYNYSVTHQQTMKPALRNQIISSFSNICKDLLVLRPTIDQQAEVENLIMSESRLRRMVVSMATRCEDEQHTAKSGHLELVAQHVKTIQRLLDDVVAGSPSDTIVKGLLADLSIVARECYTFATRFYKKQDFGRTILALSAAFELAESYLEYVMCNSSFSESDIQNSHAQLKADSIASLLAYCFREQGDSRQARIFTGHAILYGSADDPNFHKNLQKYVTAMLDELQDTGQSDRLMSDFKNFIDCILHAYKSRCFPPQLIWTLIHEFRRCADETSIKMITCIRTRKKSEKDSNFSVSGSSEMGAIALCCEIESVLADVLLTTGSKKCDSREYDVLMRLCDAVVSRNQCYGDYYERQDDLKAIDALLHLYSEISGVIDSLGEQDSVNLGGAFAWRGIITMEITLVSSYSKGDISEHKASNHNISEEHATCDIEKCLERWEHVDDDINSFGCLFDLHHIIRCLEGVCHSLTLISCPYLEKRSRALLDKFHSSGHHLSSVYPPAPLGLLDSRELVIDDTKKENLHSVKQPNRIDDAAELDFHQIDAEIALATRLQQSTDNLSQSYSHLVAASDMLRTIKRAESSRNISAIKAIGIRELVVHLVLSETYFCNGQQKRSIAESKAAFAICWKLSNKFAFSLSLDEFGHFDLPVEIMPKVESGARKSSLMYFRAPEFSSWDILHAAKFVLCRIASLYSLSGQPHRSLIYFSEAMYLVGGLDLRFFHRSPFYQYAQLQLHSHDLQQASLARKLIRSSHDVDIRNIHAGSEIDLAFMEQQCNEIIQEADMAELDNDVSTAFSLYAKALSYLTGSASSVSTSARLRHMYARCYRKITRLKTRGLRVDDAECIDDLLEYMKKLKRAMQYCSNRLERVACMCTLATANLILLQSSSPRAFTSLKKTVALLEEAMKLGDHLGVSHLSQQLRRALGTAYVMERQAIEDGDEVMDGGERLEYLFWASAMLLSDCSSVEAHEEENWTSEKDESDNFLPQTAFVLSYETFPNKLERVQNQICSIPSTWSIVSIAIGCSSELIFTRLQNNGQLPYSFCLQSGEWEKCMSEIDSVIRSSRETLSGHSVKESKTWTPEQKKRWWDDRKTLDARLGEAVQNMQRIFGFWRCLFGTEVMNDKEDEVVNQCWSILIHEHKSMQVQRREQYQHLLYSIINARGTLSEREIVDGLRYIATKLDISVTESQLREILDRVHSLPLPSKDYAIPHALSKETSRNVSKRDLSKMKVGELKDLVVNRGLSPTGTKKELIERIMTSFTSAGTPSEHSLTAHEVSKSTTSLILILDHRLQEFPWEAMDVMGSCAGVTRMPSLELLLKNAAQVVSVDSSAAVVCCERVRFLLNPEGDLRSTQTQLGPVLEDGEARFGWQGIVGRIPEPNEMRSYLLESDLFIYCGHGSGEKFFHRDQILALGQGCCAALLFGCSSGRLEKRGIFGPHGAVLSYLRAGSPAVLAMLWDVTDKDIDHLSVHLLQNWLGVRRGLGSLSTSECSLAEALSHARQVCKLKYLNGFAAVCYGLPLVVQR